MPALRTRDTQSRALEVSTDSPAPPTLAIISPTPRAFTFPLNHNLSDSPYSSPSPSPFEPDLHPLSLSYSTSSTSSFRTLSPPSSAQSSSPDHVSHRRRQSSCHSDVDRRPRKGDEDYVKRPENAFILFRRKCCEDRQQAQEDAVSGTTKKQRQADLSKTISQQWKTLSDEERKYWDDLAKEKKKEHEAMHPNYVYRPQRVKEGRAKAKKGKGKKGEFDQDTDSDCMSFVMPMSVPRHHGRSASAPTPPPAYQSVHVPNVYSTPSCPSSPSLGPLIHHSSTRPGEAIMSFDYHSPKGSLSPPSFSGYEASLQPPEYRHNNIVSNMPGTGDAGSLTMSPDSMFLSHHHYSPTSPIDSASSGSSSPRSAHYTPLTNSLASAYAQLDQHGCIDPQTQAEIDLQIQLQHDLEYNPYGWDTSLWPEANEMMVNEDFDINAIPPLSLDTKCRADFEGETSSAMSEYSQDYPHDYSQEYSQEPYQTLNGPMYDESYDGPMRYDEMLPPHSF